MPACAIIIALRASILVFINGFRLFQELFRMLQKPYEISERRTEIKAVANTFVNNEVNSDEASFPYRTVLINGQLLFLPMEMNMEVVPNS